MFELFKALFELISTLMVTSFRGAILVFAFIGFISFLKTKISKR